MSTILPCSDNQIDLLSCRIVAADNLGSLRGKEQFPAHEFQSMRRGQGAEVNGRQGFLGDQIDDRDRFTAAAVIWAIIYLPNTAYGGRLGGVQ